MQCLKGFERQTFRRFRVLICVDGSTDGTMGFLSKSRFSFPFKTIMHPGVKHKGRASTRNLCLNHLRFPYLCFLDSDIVPACDLLERHFELLNQTDCLSVGDVVYSGIRGNWVAEYHQERGRGKFNHGETMPPIYLNTQNVSLRSIYFIKTGGQDPLFGSTYGGEDTELGYRLWKSFHISAVANKKAVGYSDETKPLETWLVQLRQFGAMNLPLIRKKHPDLIRLYRMDLLSSNSLKSRFVRTLMKESLNRNLKLWLRPVPQNIRNRLIHFLVFLNIGLGYLSASCRRKETL